MVTNSLSWLLISSLSLDPVVLVLLHDVHATMIAVCNNVIPSTMMSPLHQDFYQHCGWRIAIFEDPVELTPNKHPAASFLWP